MPHFFSEADSRHTYHLIHILSIVLDVPLLFPFTHNFTHPKSPKKTTKYCFFFVMHPLPLPHNEPNVYPFATFPNSFLQHTRNGILKKNMAQRSCWQNKLYIFIINFEVSKVVNIYSIYFNIWVVLSMFKWHKPSRLVLKLYFKWCFFCFQFNSQTSIDFLTFFLHWVPRVLGRWEYAFIPIKNQKILHVWLVVSHT